MRLRGGAADQGRLISVLYAATESGVTFLLGRRLIRLNYQQADLEASFRSALIQAWENAAQIQKSGSQAQPKQDLLSRINHVRESVRKVASSREKRDVVGAGEEGRKKPDRSAGRVYPL